MFTHMHVTKNHRCCCCGSNEQVRSRKLALEPPTNTWDSCALALIGYSTTTHFNPVSCEIGHPSFGHLKWLISQWNLKFGHLGAHIFLGDWGPRVTDLYGKMGTPSESNMVTSHETETATFIHWVNSHCQHVVLASKLYYRGELIQFLLHFNSSSIN